jgi:transcriptional regulator with XRE-family HTH domain
MRSSVLDVLPPTVKRSLRDLGADMATARRKRGLTAAMVAERAGISKSTYQRVEQGDPTVMIGIYAMVLFVLGFGAALKDVVEPGRDALGLALDEERLPKRVRIKKPRPPP